ncbi:hypothetical protein [Mucilaginibacter sp.]|uniref:hypothetical protein n=1 Tax=Mucilaginibacter sp. TaxID=1882438 RepID=UPI0026305E5D|nr:hypothetical protein [Mucilaginibacter sp.]MDB4919827.1 hypothetical protein [Mucilaginibacter sp.]
MAKLELKGIVTDVFPVETVGQNQTRKQSLILTVPGYVDEYGDKKGEDELWRLDAIGDKIDALNMPAANGKKAKISVFINSKKISKADGSPMYIINVNINKIELAANQASNAAAAPAADDLPF